MACKCLCIKAAAAIAIARAQHIDQLIVIIAITAQITRMAIYRQNQ